MDTYRDQTDQTLQTMLLAQESRVARLLEEAEAAEQAAQNAGEYDADLVMAAREALRLFQTAEYRLSMLRLQQGGLTLEDDPAAGLSQHGADESTMATIAEAESYWGVSSRRTLGRGACLADDNLGAIDFGIGASRATRQIHYRSDASGVTVEVDRV